MGFEGFEVGLDLEGIETAGEMIGAVVSRYEVGDVHIRNNASTLSAPDRAPSCLHATCG